MLLEEGAALLEGLGCGGMGLFGVFEESVESVLLVEDVVDVGLELLEVLLLGCFVLLFLFVVEGLEVLLLF